MKLLNVMDEGSELYANDLAKKFTILDAIKFIIQSWAEVKKTTITTCFKNAGFCSEGNNISEALEDDVADDLAQMLQSISLEDVPYFEEDLECYAPFDQDIVDYVYKEYECTESNEELEDDGEELIEEEAIDEENITEREKVSHDDALSLLRTLEVYYEQQGEIIKVGNVSKMMREVHAKQAKCLVQKSIHHYF